MMVRVVDTWRKSVVQASEADLQAKDPYDLMDQLLTGHSTENGQIEIQADGDFMAALANAHKPEHEPHQGWHKYLKPGGGEVKNPTWRGVPIVRVEA